MKENQNIKTTDWLTRGMTKEELARAKEKAIKEAETELRNKRIEEMADEIYETLMLEAECPLSGMDCAIIANLLVSKGYRKIDTFLNEMYEALTSTLDCVPLPVIECLRKYARGKVNE